jgi:L-alanine-DL-glutamate epimerase-like enolase superfamily enzyme
MVRMKISDVRVARKERGHDRPVRDALQTLAGGGSTEVTILADPAAEGHGVISFGRIDGAPRVLSVLIEEVVRPVLVGREATNITGLLEDLKREMEYFGLSGLTRFAIAAIDTALWDLYGKLQGEPCYLLWGAQRDRLPAYAMVGWLNYDLDELRRQCGRALEHGFRGVKMKVGAATLEEDVERIAAVRSEIGPDIPLMVDANQVLSVPEALRRSTAYAEYRIAWFEEPLVAHDFDGYAELTASSPVPVAAGENLYGREEFLAFLSRRGCRVIQPDLRRAGGPSELRTIASLAASFGVPYASHGGGPAVLSVLLCAPSAIWLEAGISEGGPGFPVIEDGCALAPTGPGFEWQ